MAPKLLHAIVVVISRYPCKDLRAGSFRIDLRLSHFGILFDIVKHIEVVFCYRIDLAQAKFIDDSEAR